MDFSLSSKSNAIQKGGRVLYIDYARFFGMLCIMWGHVMLEETNHALMYSFHIPAFFFLSGIVFRAEKYSTLGSFLKRRVKTLLIPYAIYSVVTWLWWVVFLRLTGQPYGKSLFYPLAQTALSQGSGGFLVHNVPLWFVCCLFVVELAYYLLHRFSPIIRIAVSVLCAGIGWIMTLTDTPIDFQKLPWSIDVAFSALVFYACGNILVETIDAETLCQRVNSRRALSLLTALLFWGVILLLAPKNGYVTMAQGYLGDNIIGFYTLGFIGTAALLLSCALLSGIRIPQRLASFMQWFGEHSFDIMALHVPLMLIGVEIVFRYTGVAKDLIRVTAKYTFPIFLFMFVGSVALTALVDRVRRGRK